MHENFEYVDKEHLQTARGDKGDVKQQQPTSYCQEQSSGIYIPVSVDHKHVFYFLILSSGSYDHHTCPSVSTVTSDLYIMT